MGTLVALVSVFALNVALFGPTFSDMPEMSQKTINRRALAEKRTADVLAMAPTAASNANIPRYRGFGSRNLSAEEGGVMEYTRRRHRFHGDYVHVDVSGDFSAFGKWTVSIIYFAYWVFLMFPNWFLPIGRPGIALGGGLSMVVWRYILMITGNGPMFEAERVIILEPLFLLFGLMLTTIYLEKMERGGLFDKLRDSLDDPVNWKRSAKIMLMSTIGSAAVMNDSVVLIFSGVVVDLCVRHKFANSLPYLLSLATTANTGSALTLTGNPQNILIVSLMYDDISWIDFAATMFVKLQPREKAKTKEMVGLSGRNFKLLLLFASCSSSRSDSMSALYLSLPELFLWSSPHTSVSIMILSPTILNTTSRVILYQPRRRTIWMETRSNLKRRSLSPSLKLH